MKDLTPFVDQKVFRAYRSARHDAGIKKQQTPLIRLAITATVLIFVGLLGGVQVVAGQFRSDKIILDPGIQKKQRTRTIQETKSKPIPLQKSEPEKPKTIELLTLYRRWELYGVNKADFD